MVKDAVFYQSKYDYFKKLNMWVVIVISLSESTYFFSDISLFGAFTWSTFVPRFFIVIPTIMFYLMYAYIKDYRVMVSASYVMLHIIMWVTIWACTKLPDLSYASDGFIILVCTFIAVGIAAPIKYTVIAQALLFVDILIANTFLHYPDFSQFFMLGIPIAVGTDLFLLGMEKSYIDQYIIKHKLEESAYRDQLTGAYNRNIISKLSNPDTSFTNFYSGDLNIILMDIDFFKRVNDTYGHDKGDIVLKDVANVVNSIIATSDIFVRWGGEEFIIFTPGSSNNAIIMAEKIRTAIESSDNGVCPITISLGVAKYIGGPSNLSIKHADEALYTAKATGRNRVVEYKD